VRGLTVLTLLISLPLCACAPKSDARPPVALALDCALPFEVQAAKLAAQPHLVPAPHESAEPYLFYSTDDGRASYLITEEDAPGHPAIMMQTASGGDVKTTGCPYGDPKGYKQLLAYLDSLKTWSRR
jgi:hypothetical protein